MSLLTCLKVWVVLCYYRRDGRERARKALRETMTLAEIGETRRWAAPLLRLCREEYGDHE